MAGSKAKICQRKFANFSRIANARCRDLNDFFGDYRRDGIIAISKIGRAQRKRVRLVQPLDLIRFQYAFRKKATERHAPVPLGLEAYGLPSLENM